jgi:shikimate dehydrogenase
LSCAHQFNPEKSVITMDLYVVAGHPVEHSQSPFIHTEFARQTQQTLRYERLLCPLEGFKNAMHTLAQSGAKGCNITVPFKLEAAQIASRLTERAALAQAANVLCFDAQGGWLADNTDGVGLVRDIERNAGISLLGQRVLLIGAGGAAAGALGPLLAAQPSELVLANRTMARAQALVTRHLPLAGNTALRASSLTECSTGLDVELSVRFDVVINASTTSLQGAATPVAHTVLAPNALVLDMMYGPAALPFLNWAAHHGAQGRDGLGMLVEQAAVAFELWRGVAPNTAPVLQALRQRMSALD